MRKGRIVILEATKNAEHDVVSRAVAAGRMERIYDAVYSDAANPTLEQDVFDAHAHVLARMAPGAVLSGISGIRGMPVRVPGPDGRPTFPGWLFATHDASSGTAHKRPSLPGLEIRSVPGAGPLEGDMPYLGIHLPSVARQVLENLAPSRSRGGPPRTLGREGVERRLAEHQARHGDAGLIEVREHAGRIAEALGAGRELAVLREIVDGLLKVREVRFEAQELRASRRRADPYDQTCLKRLADLAAEAKSAPDDATPDPHVDRDRRECVAFVEAYFSNYIEGTKFLVDKARRIVFAQESVDGRHKDSHDVLATYRQAVAFAAQSATLARGQKVGTTYAEFEDEMRSRHAALMGARDEVRPGMFKLDPNRAGNHVFVTPDLVRGTLREGYEMLGDVDSPWRRALFLHCLSVLVHPFDDGNGRISRILMNKELVGAGQCRIVVPTIFRNDYIGAMRAMSRPEGAAPAPLLRAMGFCRRVTASIALPDLDATVESWASTNAFLEDEKEARFELPSGSAVEWRDGIPAPASYWRTVDDARDAASAIPGIGF